MRHHFADLLDRSENYWTIVPNVERYSYSLDKNLTDKENVKILTINKNDKNWSQIFDYPNLEELTLDEPNKEQVNALKKLKQLKRLRISFYRTPDIEFISDLINIEELVFEYLSGFSDLSPLKKLTNLKSLHIENLRKVSNFDGLRGIKNLRYLRIDGTLDWNQPIENFDFIGEIPNLEVISFGFITNKTQYPAFLPLLKLKKIRAIKIGLGTLDTKEYAFIQSAFPNVDCSTTGNFNWTPTFKISDGFIDFLDKGKRQLSITSPNYENRIKTAIEEYENYKIEAKKILKNYCR